MLPCKQIFHTQFLMWKYSYAPFFYSVQKTCSCTLKTNLAGVLPKRWYTTRNSQEVTSQKNAILSIANRNYVNDICVFSNTIASVTFLHPKLNSETHCTVLQSKPTKCTFSLILIYDVFYTFRNRGYIFRKTVLCRDMV